MGILTKIVTLIGALLFFTIVFVVGLAFIEYMESADEKNVRHGQQRRFLT